MQFLAQLPAKCASIVNALDKSSQRISALQEELCRVQTEHIATKALVDILLSLIEKMWLLLRTYDRQDGEALRQQHIFESVLDATLAQLDLHSLREDYGSLCRENCRLQSALKEQSAELLDEYTKTGEDNRSSIA